MPVKENQREYRMTDSELCMFTSNLVQTMTRDIAEFTLRGVDATDISALEALGNAFEIFPPDSYYQSDVSIAVNDKNIKRTDLEIIVRDVVQCAIIKWGPTSPQYKKFGSQMMTSMGDMKFLTMCRQVVTTATDYLAQLADAGLTQLMIDDVNIGAQEFEENMNAINSAMETRDIKTNERIVDGNELYSYVVKYCQIGKIIWQDIDSAKYNDYVIYPTSHPVLSKPQNLAVSFDLLDPSPVTLSWDLVANATSYDVYYNIAATGAPSGSFTLLNNFPTSPALVPPIFEKRNYYKIKAKNDTDTSPYSDEVWADIPAAP